MLFDRNNHKSNHHGALVLGGGIPVYLPTGRNPQGLIGPIDPDALDEEHIRAAIRANPLVTDPDRWQAVRPFRLAIIEQCSYDGTIYNVQMILDRIGHLCDYILFDEAWAGFMKFHPLFSGHYAMGLDSLGPDDPGIIATQSTHKQLAGFSQASQIHLKSRHIQDQPRHVSELRFNEAYMLHASTSPFYPLFSSLDVGAQMMKGRNGFHLWNEATRLAVEMRKTIRRLLRTFEAQAGDGSPPPWFFDPFVPNVVTVTGSRHTADLHDVPWEQVPTRVLLTEQQCWQLQPGARWHGFTRLTDGYAMTDPNKLTLVTPGLDRETDGYLDWGVPAPVLAQFLRERGIIPEKNDLNTILFLVTPGIEVSKAGTLITTLLDFKRFFDGNLPLRDVLPEFVAARPQIYGDERLRDLCLRMHDFYRRGHTSELQRQQFQAGHFPEMALSPQEATRLFTANQIDYVPIDEVSGAWRPRWRWCTRPASASWCPASAGTSAPRPDRLPQAVRGELRPLPRIHERDPGRLPGERRGWSRAPVHLRHQGIADEECPGEHLASRLLCERSSPSRQGGPGVMHFHPRAYGVVVGAVALALLAAACTSSTSSSGQTTQALAPGWQGLNPGTGAPQYGGTLNMVGIERCRRHGLRHRLLPHGFPGAAADGAPAVQLARDSRPDPDAGP